MIGYKQCKNTFPSPHTEHNLSIAIIKSLYCKCISLLKEPFSKVYLCNSGFGFTFSLKFLLTIKIFLLLTPTIADGG